MKLKRWVEILLIVIGILATLVLMSDCANTVTFIVTHFIATIVLIAVATVLFKYGR